MEDLPRILIVDDESGMRFLVRLTLEQAGHLVDEAPDGRAALEQAVASPPDAVVTDYMMPVMDGAELIDRLRSDARTARIPILVLSASDGTERLAADGVLRKPLRADDLVRAVETLLAERSDRCSG